MPDTVYSQIELLAGFCLGQCMHGVVVQVGEQKIIGVFPEQVEELSGSVLPEVILLAVLRIKSANCRIATSVYLCPVKAIQVKDGQYVSMMSAV